MKKLLTAALLGAETTANAYKAGASAPLGVTPTNLYFTPSDRSRAQLLEEMGEGVFITNVKGLHAGANPTTGDFSLEAKGYLIRQANPKDGRSQLLFATEKAEGLRNSKAQVETTFYEWLLAELPEAEKIAFCKTLDTIYRRSKQESRAGFPHITALTEQGEGERHE